MYLKKIFFRSSKKFQTTPFLQNFTSILYPYPAFLAILAIAKTSHMADFGSRLEVICLESEAFYALIDEVVERLKEKNKLSQDKWIDDEEAMRLLRISSKTTLQKYRDEGMIRFTQPSRKIILYDRDSIDEFLEKNSKDTF